MSTTDIISLNTRGLRDSGKRRKLFHYLHTKKFQVMLLQETHTSVSQEAIWKTQLGGKSVRFSHGTNNSRGVAIVIANHCKHEIHQVINNVNGRYIIMDITLGEQRLTLANIYGPNEDKKDFFIDVMDIIGSLPNDNKILGGDFNIILDFELDRTGGSNQAVTNSKAREVIQQ